MQRIANLSEHGMLQRHPSLLGNSTYYSSQHLSDPNIGERTCAHALLAKDVHGEETTERERVAGGGGVPLAASIGEHAQATDIHCVCALAITLNLSYTLRILIFWQEGLDGQPPPPFPPSPSCKSYSWTYPISPRLNKP